MRNKNLIIKKAKILQAEFNNLENFNINEAVKILQEARSTVYWTLSNLVKAGYLKRVGHGLYTFLKKGSPPNPIISALADKILKLLIETEYDFFISGLDVLSIFMQHIPETSPVILFINKYSKEEIINLLISQNYNLQINKRDNSVINNINNKKADIYLHLTTEFNYSEKSLAIFEKAFVYLYYEVTRMNYPLPLQELEKIYTNMRRRLYLNTKKLVKIAARRNIHSEISNIILHNSVLAVSNK